MMGPDAFSRPRELKCPIVALVEGLTPMHVLRELVKQMGLGEMIQVEDFGGQDEFARTLKQTLEEVSVASGFAKRVRVIAVFRDAELRIADAMRQATRDSVKSLLGGGSRRDLRKAFSTLRIETFIFPDNDRPGMFEEICLQTFENSPVAGCVDQFAECVANAVPSEGRKVVDQPKSRLQMFLAATKGGSGVSLATAARDGALNLDHPAFQSLRDFLVTLSRL